MINVQGIQYSSTGEVMCDGDLPRLDAGSKFKAGACNIYINGFVPVSGQYRIELMLDTPNRDSSISNPFYVEANINVSQQSLNATSSDQPINYSTPYAVHTCYLLLNEAGQSWAITRGRGCDGYTPIPPTPPQPPTSCTINNGSTLNVNLGTVDRAQLVTVPGTGSIHHTQIPVECTGDVTSIPVIMKLSYTPLTIGGEQVVKSSANGLGVTIIYNNQPLSTSDSTSINFVPGSNTLDLGFEAVRNPATPVGDVPTGAFSASATVIMTQQ
ncbi:hypothetical protein CJP72_21135 [Citrobacter sp. NCU1]|nr:hypothetical protein [Citrobacter sp. NCU1]